jgi:hypothetical protein
MNRLALISFLLAAASGSVHADLITNGTFDTGTSGWTLSGSGCQLAVFDGGGNPGPSVWLNACGEGGSNPTLSQTVSGLTVGATYLLTFDLSGSGTDGDGGNTFGIFLDSEPTNAIYTTEVGGAWHSLSTTFAATATSQTLFFEGELDTRTVNGPGTVTDVDYHIDNISLDSVAVATPEPAVFGLAASGLGALFLLRRLKA